MAKAKKKYEPKFSQDELRQKVEDKIKDVLPPWVRGYDKEFMLPRNCFGHIYSGLNALIGMAITAKRGSAIFGTSKQWYRLAKKLGYFDNGSKPLLAVDENGKKAQAEIFIMVKRFDKRLKTQEEIARTPERFLIKKGDQAFRHCSFMKAFFVYNLMDLADGLREMVQEHLEKRGAGVDPHGEFDELVSGLNVNLEHGVGLPCYIPKKDKVRMPPKEVWDSSSQYYSTLAHEVGHWTGAEKRMNRDGIVKDIYFGSDPYAEEEAVAEWFSLIAVNHFGIEGERGLDNGAAYIQGWTKRFKDDPRLMTRTFQAAMKAFEWAMNEAGIEMHPEEVEEEKETAAA